MGQRVKKKNPVPAQAVLGAGRLLQYSHASYQHYSSRKAIDFKDCAILVTKTHDHPLDIQSEATWKRTIS